MSLASTFETMWRDYTSLNPTVLDIENVFKKRGESLVNDHVAFRTFNHKDIGLDAFKSFFLKQGYEVKGDYHFKAKKLFAQHLEHPSGEHPKVFISELLVEQLSTSSQSIITRLIEQIPHDLFKQNNYFVAGRPWNVSYSDYHTLLQESEYAAWMSAFGFRVNHFTVLVNALQTLRSVAEVNQALKNDGFKLNTSGGEIKGSETIGLMQSSTMAAEVSVHFTDGQKNIPGCYYEFAQRFEAQGTLYGGFVEQSADKIFESTNVRNNP